MNDYQRVVNKSSFLRKFVDGNACLYSERKSLSNVELINDAVVINSSKILGED